VNPIAAAAWWAAGEVWKTVSSRLRSGSVRDGNNRKHGCAGNAWC